MFEYDDRYDDIKYNEQKEYTEDEVPIDIGMWVSYMPYNDEIQLQLQRENLLSLPISNHYGKIAFILSKNINNYENYLENISKDIRIENTETILDTEVYYTCKIEGAKTTKKRTFEIHNGSKIKDDNKFSEAMIKGNFEAVKLLNLYGNRINSKILYKVWNILTKDCKENLEIEGIFYRNGDVSVTNSDFIAVNVNEIENKMNDLISFYSSDILNDKPFIKACIIHYNFETIHPFCDGNGRMGRLLMNNYLISQGIESCRAVSFSEQIDKTRGLYDGAFINSENIYSDCTPFLEYMLQTMSNAYFTAYKTQRREM
jgi:Fic family protein